MVQHICVLSLDSANSISIIMYAFSLCTRYHLEGARKPPDLLRRRGDDARCKSMALPPELGLDVHHPSSRHNRLELLQAEFHLLLTLSMLAGTTQYATVRANEDKQAPTSQAMRVSPATAGGDCTAAAETSTPQSSEQGGAMVGAGRREAGSGATSRGWVGDDAWWGRLSGQGWGSPGGGGRGGGGEPSERGGRGDAADGGEG